MPQVINTTLRSTAGPYPKTHDHSRINHRNPHPHNHCLIDTEQGPKRPKQSPYPPISGLYGPSKQWSLATLIALLDAKGSAASSKFRLSRMGLISAHLPNLPRACAQDQMVTEPKCMAYSATATRRDVRNRDQNQALHYGL